MKQLQIRSSGFTMLEMMATVSTVAVLATMGAPSYTEFVEKRKLAGAADQLASFVTLARGGAVKHNQPMTISFNRTDSTDWCLGMTLGLDACDCTLTTVSDQDYCALKYTDDSATAVVEPQMLSSSDFSGFELAAATTGSGDSAITFDPVRGTLADFADIASFTLQSDHNNYELKVNVSATGTIKTCTSGVPVSGYKSCQQ